MAQSTYDAVRSRAALLSSVALIAFAGQAFAAEPAAPEGPAVEEIVITGSRLRVAAPVGSSLIGVNRDQITNSSALNATQLFQEVPQVLNLGVSDSSRGQSGGAANTNFSNSINIRGLGPYSTLTLIDGHRAVPQGSTGFGVDPAVIPTMAIQRLDIVADGASAIYGSDAVAGVANIILRRNVQGVEAQMRLGDGRGYNERQFGVIGGVRWNGGQLTIAGEKTFRDNVKGADRDFFRADLRDWGGNDYRLLTCNPGNIVVSGVSYAIPQGGVTAANRAALIPGTANRCDPLKVIDLLPQQERESAVFTLDHRINDWLKLDASGFYSTRTYRSLGNITTTTLAVPRTNAFFVAPPGLNPATESVQYSFAGVYPQSEGRGTSRTRQIQFGGEAMLPADWRLSADVVVGKNTEFRNNTPTATAARLTAALASSDPATAFNPFGVTNPAVIQNILANVSQTTGDTDHRNWQAQLDGGLFTLPGGEVRMAVGYEGQFLRINPATIDGLASAPRTRTKTRSRTVHSGFAEMLVPLVGDGNARAGIQRLELNLAGRYDHYDDVGDTWNPKVGVNWTVTPGLVVHGSYGTSFRAPAMTQLYGTGGGTLALFVQNYTDPTCNCVRQGLTSTGENPNIVPEEARTYSLGVDWRPPQVRGLNVSLNYFNIHYDKQIQAYISDLSVLGREAQFAGTGLITRNPDPAFISALVAQAEAVNGVIPTPLTLFVNGNAINTGATNAQGLDFQVSYAFPAGDFGDVTLAWNGSYFLEYRQSFGPAGPMHDILDTIYNPLRFKWRATARWAKGPWNANLGVTYVNSYKNNVVNPTQVVDRYTPVDFRVGYTFNNVFAAKRLNLALDVRNAFDIKPPFVNIAQSANGGGGFDPTAADPTGRVISLVLNAAF